MVEKEPNNKKESNKKDKKSDIIPSRRTTTNITTILAPEDIMHLDPIKMQRRTVSLKTTMRGLFPDSFLPQDKVDLLCWWCHHDFETPPIGLPIVRHDKQLDTNVTKYVPEIYEVTGIFCSFPCAVSYVKHNNNDITYKDSLALLHEMYYRFYNKHVVIDEAPDWRLLKSHGGDMTITAFRNTRGKDMKLTPNNASLVYQVPLGKYVET